MTAITKHNRNRNRANDSLVDLLFDRNNVLFGSSFLPNETDLASQYDIIENDNEYIIEFMLPGFKKENISIDINGNMLTIEGERKVDENTQYNYRGSFYGNIKQSFTLPDDANINNINASHDNGILSIFISKEKNKSSNKKIKIN
jgi:HSP20 family protein